MSAEEAANVDAGHPDYPLRLDNTPNFFVSAWGRKKSGKSVLNRLIYREWPGDKLCIDVNGDAEPGPDAERLSLPLPNTFPRELTMPGERRRPRNLHFRAHPGSSTYKDDLDRAVGLALYPQDHKVLLWGGEVGELQPNGRPIGPAMRTILMQNRHYNVSCLWDGPRPMNVDTLTLTQSDLVAMFPLPQARDRQRLAETIGIGVRELEQQMRECWGRGKHWFLLYNLEQDTLWHVPPLPVDPDTAGGEATDAQHAA